jgi:hypothetical protein
VLYLYAFAQRPAAVPDVPGIGGSRLAVEEIGDVDAVVSDVPGDSVAASEEAILEHARVVEAVFEQSEAVLPARFGRAYADVGSLRQAAIEHEAELRAALERVRGSVELGIRVLAPTAENRPPATSGRDYLTARLDERRRIERLADELNAPLAEVARSATRSVGATERLLLSAAFLVPRGDVDRFRSVVERLQREHPELTVVCTGPWPAYSFATVEGGGGH